MYGTVPIYGIDRKEIRRIGTVPLVAGGQGFEPRLMEPESIVLPLDDPPLFVPVPARRSASVTAGKRDSCLVLG